ncbi:MAG: DUF6089 family protein [Ferruginibacter sp.]
MPGLSKKIIVLPLFMSLTIMLHAQEGYKWMVGVNGGMLIYQGDLAPSALGSYKTPAGTLGFSLTKIINPSFAVRGTAVFGSLKGDDKKYNDPSWRPARALSFSTPVKEFSAQLIWNPYSNNSNETGQRLTPYLFAGAGVSFLNITRDYSRIDTVAFPSSSKQQQGLRRDTATTLPRSAFVVPLGVGLSYYLSPRWSVNFETNFRYMFTDYLDGFSYVANPEMRDFYHSHTLGLVYRFGGGDGSSGGKNGDNLGCPKF